MAHDAHVYGEIDSRTDLKNVFLEIRHDVESAHSRPALTELHKRAGYLITLTHAPSWQETLGRGKGGVSPIIYFFWGVPEGEISIPVPDSAGG